MMVTTPLYLVDEVIRTVCGQRVDHRVRLTSGGLNETYLVTLRCGTSVIVRIARRETPWFVDEAHVITQARGVGIPAPEVFGVEHIQHEGALLSFSVLSVIQGQSLADLVAEVTADKLERIVMDAGELLAHLNSISPARGIMHQVNPPADVVVERAAQTAHHIVGPEAAYMVEQGAAFLTTQLKMSAMPEMVLAHGDWLPKHFMVDDGQITGIIDWEFAGSAIAAREIARWEISAGAPFDQNVGWLLNGYARVMSRDIFDDGWVAACAVDWCLEVLGWRNPASPARIRRCVEMIAQKVQGSVR